MRAGNSEVKMPMIACRIRSSLQLLAKLVDTSRDFQRVMFINLIRWLTVMKNTASQSIFWS